MFEISFVIVVSMSYIGNFLDISTVCFYSLLCIVSCPVITLNVTMPVTSYYLKISGQLILC